MKGQLENVLEFNRTKLQDDQTLALRKKKEETFCTEFLMNL